MRNKIFWLSLFALLSFGSVAEAQTDSHAYDDIHSIGIFSALVPAAVTPGGPVPLDWDINTDVANLITGALKDRFSIKTVSFDRGQLQKTFADESFQGLSKFIQSNSPQDVDAYLIVVADKVPDFMTAIPAGPLLATFSLPFFPGLSLRDDSDWLHPHAEITVMATYDLIVVKANSGEIIGWSRANMNDVSHRGAVMTFCKNDFLPRTATELDGPKGKVVLDEMKILVFSGLTHALKTAGLPAQVDLAGAIPVQPELCPPPR